MYDVPQHVSCICFKFRGYGMKYTKVIVFHNKTGLFSLYLTHLIMFYDVTSKMVTSIYFHMGLGVTSCTKTHSSLFKAPNNYASFVLLSETFQMT